MKRTVSVLLVVALATATLCGVGDSQEARAREWPRQRPAGPTTSGRSVRRSMRLHGPSRTAMPGPSPALFSEDGEAIDSEGGTIQGRTALASHYAARLADAPGDKLETAVETIAFLAPGVARVTGRTRETSSSGSAPAAARYAGIYVKRDGRWLLASVREISDKELTPHQHLADLEWLVGDWVEETDEAVVNTSVAWTDNGNFLLRSFGVRVKGKPALTGTQRIGWDPLTKQLKSWVFDSNGGYGEGLWMRQGDQWVIKATGVRPTAASPPQPRC